ncbi:MAG: MgtC/SapB family protein [archaeon]
MVLGEIDLTVRVLISLGLGALIGLERERDEEPAGLRTHMLVCMGATLFTVISLSFSDAADPTRIAAGIVMGIGFLGAGTIFKIQDKIKGLTTAADLWVLAGIGMAVGIGYYFVAIVTAFLVLATLYFGRILKKAKPQQGESNELLS